MKILISIFITISIHASQYNALLFSGNCIACHDIYNNISAPSIMEIKEQYIMAYPNKKDFINYMSIWAEHPNRHTSLMQYSIKKYELMPELGFDRDTLEKISTYIFETNFKN